MVSIDMYHSIDSVISLVHVYGHHNSGSSASNLTPLLSLNFRLNELAEYIVASLLRLMAPITPLWVGFSDPYGLPIVYICRVPFIYNTTQSIVYETYKHYILQYWVEQKLTKMENGGELTSYHWKSMG